MRARYLSALALAAALATPAFAQSGKSSDQSSQQAGQKATAQSTQQQTMSQEKLRSQLEKAGFSKIEIIDAAFLVRAEGPDGDKVLMYIDPPNNMADGTGSSASGSDAGTSKKSSN
ncbi:hypothetical protein [Marinimicrococcus flavescens]|uniref:PepSY domain-containing protein n=1 Tax=Marinimicrococcus flavescens TaxID=3031815 RepID=A0AAP3UXD9_9PROT|nr:hypothetical protein [Marinimicrococcus flavescens]